MRAWLVAAGIALAAVAHAAEDAFPSRPVTLIAPFVPGGSGDLVARSLAERLAAGWNRPVQVENKPGAAAVVATQALLAAPADGHTLMLTAANVAINPVLLKKLPYDSARDLQPLALVATNPHVLVIPAALPPRDLKSFIAWAKARPKPAAYASFGQGTSAHLGFERFKQAAGIDLVHIPFKGAVPAVTALLAGEVDAMLSDTQQVLQYAPGGRLRALAVGGTERSPSLPDVPTFDEAGLPGFVSHSWFGLLLRAGTPPATVAALQRAAAQALAAPELRRPLKTAGIDAADPAAATPEQFQRYIERASAEYRQIVETARIEPD